MARARRGEGLLLLHLGLLAELLHLFLLPLVVLLRELLFIIVHVRQHAAALLLRLFHKPPAALVIFDQILDDPFHSTIPFAGRWKGANAPF